MPSAYTQNFFHLVFSTKQRKNLIAPALEDRLYPFVGGVVRDLRCTLLAINSMPEHQHLLVRYRPDLSHSDLVRHVKSRSSKWLNEEFSQFGRFAWQEGYGGFTVSKSSVPEVESYIARQKERHLRMEFMQEYLELLRRHEISFNPDEVFR